VDKCKPLSGGNGEIGGGGGSVGDSAEAVIALDRKHASQTAGLRSQLEAGAYARPLRSST
jgi:hypothetical protein